MPYLYESFNGDDARTVAAGLYHNKSHGPFVPAEDCMRVELVTVICSGFKDPGDDWSLLIAYDGLGEELGRVRISGY